MYKKTEKRFVRIDFLPTFAAQKVLNSVSSFVLKATIRVSI